MESRRTAESNNDQDPGEDTTAHERPGMRIDDSQSGEEDLDKTGAIEETERLDAWG